MIFYFSKKQVLLFGGIFFLIQSIFAVYFYHERLFTDSSYFFFNTINTGWFTINHQRYILVFAEFLPLLGSWLGFSLKTLLLLYSLNQVLFFLALFLILLERNDLNGALTIIALLAFATQNLFVNQMLEIWYGAGFAILFFSFLQKDTLSKKDYVWVVLLEITVLFSHPENFILVLFLTLLDIEKNRALNRKHLLLCIILIATGIVKYFTWDAYERGKFNFDFKIVGIHHYMYIFHMDYAKDIIVLLLTYYWILLLLVTISFLRYAFTGKYLRAIIVFLSFAGTVALLNIVASNNVFSNYGSIMYIPLISIAVVPFFFDVFETMKIRTKTIAFSIFVVLVGFRLFCLPNALSSFTERVNQMECIINAADKLGGSKFIVNSNDFEKPYQLNWALPIETLLFSAERGKDKCRSIITEKDTENVQKNIIVTDSNVFILRQWTIMNTGELNPKYFQFQKGIYKTLNFQK